MIDDLDDLAARLVSSRTGTTAGKAVDLGRIEAAVRDILLAIGEDPDRPGLKETPSRVAHAYAELFAGLRADPREVLAISFDEGHRELVIVRDVEVHSFCEHHLLPFTGWAHIGYVPGESGGIVGLSKLARLVEIYARRPQVQERLTSQIADEMHQTLDAAGVVVVIECEHMCMSMRGIRKAGASTVTSAVRGTMRTDPRTRNEALELLRSAAPRR